MNLSTYKNMFINLDKQKKDKIAAIDTQGRCVTYEELIKFSSNWENYISSRCLIMILGDNTIGGLAGYIASMVTKRVPIIVGSGIKEDALERLKEEYRPQYYWMPQKLVKAQEEVIVQKYEYALVRGYENGYSLHEELSLLLTTSGSTGSPKLVRHSYKNLEVQARNISEFFEIQREDRALVSLPIQYTMAISSINSYLYKGATLLLSDLSLLSPQLWKFVKEREATSFTGVPYSFELLHKLKIHNQDFPSLSLMTQGGGKLAKEIQIQFAEYMHKKGGRYIATYGQTEGSARMAYLPDQYSISKCGSIGIATPNGEISIIDDKGEKITEANKPGEMIFSGDNVTLGYAERGEDLIKGDENHGILHTGDLVYRDEDGFIFIVGRKKRFLKLFGHRVSLDECEQIIKNEFGIDCACAGNDKALSIYLTEGQMMAQVKSLIIEKTELYTNSVEVILIDGIPKNEAGKTLYSHLGTKN